MGSHTVINKAQLIKDRVSMKEILAQYGYKPDRAGFICCPFHHEKTPSMKVYENDYHCFGCGEHGDVISFVEKLFGLTFSQALMKLDDDFGLNICATKSFEELRQAQYRARELQAKRERERIEREKAEAEYLEIYAEWMRLDKNKREYAPKTPYEEWHPLYVEAMQKIDYQRYLLDSADERRCNEWMNKQYN